MHAKMSFYKDKIFIRQAEFFVPIVYALERDSNAINKSLIIPLKMFKFKYFN